MKEIVLPSGRFATLRPITWWDKVLTSNANIDLMILTMACRIVKIDKQELTMDAAQEMPLHEANPIIVAVGAAYMEALGIPKAEAPAEQPAARFH